MIRRRVLAAAFLGVAAAMAPAWAAPQQRRPHIIFILADPKEMALAWRRALPGPQ